MAPRKDADQQRRKSRTFASSTPLPPDSEFSDGDSGHPLDDDDDELHERTHSSVNALTQYSFHEKFSRHSVSYGQLSYLVGVD